MSFRIGEVYRYTSQKKTEGVPEKIVDGLRTISLKPMRWT